MPPADAVIQAVYQIIQPDRNVPGLLHGPFRSTDLGQADTLHFAAHDDTQGVGAKGELAFRRAARKADVSCGFSSQMHSSLLPDLRH